MKLTQHLATAMIVSLLLVALPGCQKQGPAERAGEALDDAATSLGEHVEDAGDAIQDAAESDK
jgi:hypothetical protein